MLRLIAGKTRNAEQVRRLGKVTETVGIVHPPYSFRRVELRSLVPRLFMSPSDERSKALAVNVRLEVPSDDSGVAHGALDVGLGHDFEPSNAGFPSVKTQRTVWKFWPSSRSSPSRSSS
jgi:hypothetical protein